MPLEAATPKTLVPARVATTFRINRYEVDVETERISIWWSAGTPTIFSGVKEISLNEAKVMLGQDRFTTIYATNKKALYDLMIGSGQFPTGTVS